jgi:hypothetical protein
MEVLSEMRKQLSLPIASPLGSIEMEKECPLCDSWQRVEAEDQLFLLEEGDILDDLMIHLKSEYFRVSRGAMNRLKERYTSMLLTIYRLWGVDEI